MRLFSWAGSAMMAALWMAPVAIGSETTGTMEVDLVFPRNETYAPTESFPIIFAIQNSHLASIVIPFISITVRDWNNLDDHPLIYSYEARWANFSTSDPYFIFQEFSQFKIEGVWMLGWQVGWQSCRPDPLATGDYIISNNLSSSGLSFTTKKSAKAVDLVADTDRKNCSEDAGMTFVIKDTLDPPTRDGWNGRDQCAVLESATPAPNPCRVKIDSTAASSIAASLTAEKCDSWFRDDSCPPEDKSISQKLTVGGVALLSGVLGAVGYMLM